MESGVNKKIKVVWICHFINKDLIELFNSNKISDMAPWINELIKIFSKSDLIKLYIVAPNLITKKNQNFTFNNIEYHFFMSSFFFKNSKYFNLSIFWFSKRKVKKIIEKISPDLIHLHGAENAYYSSSILQFIKKYPILVTIQGFVFKTLPQKWPNELVRKRRIRIERKILQSVSNFGIRAIFMENELLKFNKFANFYWHNYPINVPHIDPSLEEFKKEYDCVFFARITKDKGIEDLLKAIAIAKKKKKDITLQVLGGANENYLSYLDKLCEELNIKSNVKFLGFLPQNELFREANKSKISILPTYNDIIPGTVIESMFLKIPVISYCVDGLPDVNNNKENIILLKKGDINGLADKIIKLLNDDDLRQNYSDNAFEKAKEMFNNDKILPALINIYTDIINKFQRKKVD
ncbi:MAG: glycosyltransferase [Melioribacteraceae bacterium]